MGIGPPFALGLCLAQPDTKVILFDGDGSLLMNLGSLVTIAEAAPKNLIHCVFGNGTYAVNGGHPIPGAGTLDFAGLAHAAGYRKVLQCADIARLSEVFAKALQQDGPIFVDLRVEHEGEIPLDYDALFSAERRRLFKTALDRA